jgi:hypothetical protein
MAKSIWYKLVDDFISVRTFITLGAFGLAYYLMARDLPVPDLLKSIVDLLLGFWFGSKVGQAMAKQPNQSTGGEEK